MGNVQVSPEGIAGDTTKRQLHVFFLVDNSGSMAGKKIQKVNWAIRDLLPEMGKLEDDERIRIYMGSIVFGSSAKWHVGPDPVSVEKFSWKDLDGGGGGTSTAQAIKLLTDALGIEKMGARNIPPVCILLSDGYCTDPHPEYEKAIAALNNQPWGKKAVRLSIGIAQHDNDYSKDELDMFISPYLRKENNLETLHADTPQKLLQYIKTTSTMAVKAASDSRSDTESTASTTPVQFAQSDIEDKAGAIFGEVQADESW